MNQRRTLLSDRRDLFVRPVGCVLFAVMLQCAGCSAGGLETEAQARHEARSTNELADQVPMNSPLRGTSSAGSTLRPISASNPEATVPGNMTYLPAESALVELDGISANMTDQIIESREAFSKALQEMSNDENRSMEAQDLAKHYRDAFERAVGSRGAVGNLSCGLSVCMGSVTAGSVADHDAWLSRLHDDPGAATYGFIEAIESTGDHFQSRFVFSTDPALKAIIVH